MRLIRWTLKPLHTWLEKYCSQRVGRWHVGIQQAKTTKERSLLSDPGKSWWFRSASRLEFKLRYICYPIRGE